MSAVGYPANPGDNADFLIEEARHRQRRRRAWLIAAVVMASAVAAAIAFSFGGGLPAGSSSQRPAAGPSRVEVNSYPPGRTSPIVTVYSGSDWNIVAWMSHKGLCISYGAPGAAGNGCEGTQPAIINLWGGVVALKRPFTISTVSGEERGGLYGTVSGKVATLVLKLASGRNKSVPLRAEPALHVTRRFFYVSEREFEAEQAPGTLIAYDLHGRIVARRTV
jgi:hypothetical protein